METFGLFCLYGLASYEDIKTRQVKLIEIALFAVIGIIINFVYKPYPVLSVFGGVMVGLLIYIFSLLSHEKIGKGDALIIMVTGLYLGFINTVVLVWLSSFLAAVFGALYLSRKYKSFEMEIPFVPFLLAGYCLIVVLSKFGGIFR